MPSYGLAVHVYSTGRFRGACVRGGKNTARAGGCCVHVYVHVTYWLVTYSRIVNTPSRYCNTEVAREAQVGRPRDRGEPRARAPERSPHTLSRAARVLSLTRGAQRRQSKGTTETRILARLRHANWRVQGALRVRSLVHSSLCSGVCAAAALVQCSCRQACCRRYVSACRRRRPARFPAFPPRLPARWRTRSTS